MSNQALDAQQPSFIRIESTDSALAAAEALSNTIETLATTDRRFNYNGRKVAYVTFCTQSYLFGLVGLARSLAQHTQIPLICLCESELDLDNTTLDNVHFVRVPSLVTRRFNPGRQEFAATLTKLWSFGITTLDAIVFLDVDMVVLKNIDELFALTGVYFCPDYVDHSHTQRFNSGLFVLSGEKIRFLELLRFCRSGQSYDGGDQGLLNEFFSGNYDVLPMRYNVLKHYMYYSDRLPLDVSRTCVIHYIVKKPWELKYRESADAFMIGVEDIWTSFLNAEDLKKLVSHWRKEIFLHYERQTLSDPLHVWFSKDLDSKKIRRRLRRTIYSLALGAFAGAIVVGYVVGSALS